MLDSATSGLGAAVSDVFYDHGADTFIDNTKYLALIVLGPVPSDSMYFPHMLPLSAWWLGGLQSVEFIAASRYLVDAGDHLGCQITLHGQPVWCREVLRARAAVEEMARQ